MTAPLDGLMVAVHASGVAAAYAARLLGVQGAEVIFVEPPCGSALRGEPPFLVSGEGAKPTSALFAYLAAGARSMTCDLATGDGQAALGALLSECDIFIDDSPRAGRQNPNPGLSLDEAALSARHPQLVHVSVLPFGAHGPKADWQASEITVQHASGEGNLLPNGLSVELFPDRAPVKIAGHFAEMQGGIAAALGALSALWVRDEVGGQFVDIASQDAALAVGAFAIQRLGDGSIEHRVERSFRYGGVIPCADGHVELLTLEQRQWDGLVKLLGSPEWALDPALADSLERSRRGPEINRHIREWAIVRKVDDIVAEGQKLSVPIGRYKTPAEILRDPQEHHRGLFQPVAIPGSGLVDMLVSPVHVDGAPLSLRGGPPELGEMNKVSAEVLS
ncbi:CoA transferase [Novosphingobium sp. BL-8A]|uniref:CoA transferase n=1 Tax=Novosphingobium sp. BL-8A TaxID=3127639 RepID=UPI003756A7AE